MHTHIQIDEKTRLFAKYKFVFFNDHGDHKNQMPPNPKKHKPADDSRRPAAKDKTTKPKDKRERSLSSVSTHTMWHGMGNAFKPGF